MDGRVYTLEDEIDVLHEDLGRARRHLWSLERAELDGRMTNEPELARSIRHAKQKVATLERELGGACADQIAAAEGFRS